VKFNLGSLNKQKKLREMLIYCFLETTAWWLIISRFTGANPLSSLTTRTVSLMTFSLISAFLIAFIMDTNFSSNLILPIGIIGLIPIILDIEKLTFPIFGLLLLLIIGLFASCIPQLQLQNYFGLLTISLLVVAVVPITIYYGQYHYFPNALFTSFIAFWFLTAFFLEPYFTKKTQSISITSIVLLGATVIAIFFLSHIFLAFVSVILLLVSWYAKPLLLKSHWWLIIFGILQIIISFAL